MNFPNPFARKQTRSRPRTRVVRHFNAAKTDNLVASWTSTPTNIDQALVAGLSVLRARSRDLMRNTPFARRFRAMVQANVIGHNGVGLSSLVTDRVNPDSADKMARAAIEHAWMKYGAVADFLRAQHLVDMENILMGLVATDGEAFVLKRRNGPGQAPVGKYGIEYQIVDAELVDVRHNVALPNGHSVTMGIEKDAVGRVVAYYLGAPPQVNTYSSYYTANNTTTRVPAEDMIHIFIREEVGQTRGIPWLAAAMLRYNMLDGYMEAALVAARTGAAKALAITTEGGDFTGDDEDADGAPIIDLSDPGQTWLLREGEKLDAYDPSYPHGEMPDFIKTCLREIAAGSGFGVSYNLLSGDLEGVSFSSIRHAIIEEQGQWMALQEWFIRSFMQPVFMDWIASAVAHEAITIKGKPLRSTDIDRYEAVAWRPRRWAWIDPLKDVNAAKIQVAEGFKSQAQIIRELGGDPDDVRRESEGNVTPAVAPVVPKGESDG